MNIKNEFDSLMADNHDNYNVVGAISSKKTIFPLGSDTKVLSSIFELFSRPLILDFAERNGFQVVEPAQQNHYPDFTLQVNSDDRNKIAIDVKTTYVNTDDEKFKFTLGGYTSFIRNNTKNIVFPFDHYGQHWVMGYVYTRVALKKAAALRAYQLHEIKDIQLPYRNVRTFFQEKWRISGDKAGSGNTNNIGSICGRIDDFDKGRGVFASESEFLDYWRNYEPKEIDRAHKYTNVQKYREWRSKSL